MAPISIKSQVRTRTESSSCNNDVDCWLITHSDPQGHPLPSPHVKAVRTDEAARIMNLDANEIDWVIEEVGRCDGECHILIPKDCDPRDMVDRSVKS